MVEVVLSSDSIFNLHAVVAVALVVETIGFSLLRSWRSIKGAMSALGYTPSGLWPGGTHQSISFAT